MQYKKNIIHAHSLCIFAPPGSGSFESFRPYCFSCLDTNRKEMAAASPPPSLLDLPADVQVLIALCVVADGERMALSGWGWCTRARGPFFLFLSAFHQPTVRRRPGRTCRHVLQDGSSGAVRPALLAAVPLVL